MLFIVSLFNKLTFSYLNFQPTHFLKFSYFINKFFLPHRKMYSFVIAIVITGKCHRIYFRLLLKIPVWLLSSLFRYFTLFVLRIRNPFIESMTKANVYSVSADCEIIIRQVYIPKILFYAIIFCSIKQRRTAFCLRGSENICIMDFLK